MNNNSIVPIRTSVGPNSLSTQLFLTAKFCCFLIVKIFLLRLKFLYQYSKIFFTQLPLFFPRVLNSLYHIFLHFIIKRLFAYTQKFCCISVVFGLIQRLKDNGLLKFLKFLIKRKALIDLRHWSS